jgi:hypothetical protein
MTVDFAYDPVTATDEATATGETAVLFAEIRQIMRIPLVTSIWRGLAGMGDSLRLAWAAAKPIYESGEPERALTRSVAAVGLPRPEPLAPNALACMGLTEDQWTVSHRSRMIVCERPVKAPGRPCPVQRAGTPLVTHFFRFLLRARGDRPDVFYSTSCCPDHPLTRPPRPRPA